MKPGGWAAAWLAKTSLSRKAVGEPYFSMILAAGLSLGGNLLYALYHGVIAWLQGSLWFWAMCAFYGVLALLRFLAVWYARKRRKAPSAQTRIIQGSGLLLMLLSIILAGVNYLSLSQKIAVKYEKITMITIATYTFYKITMAVIQRVKQRAAPSSLGTVLRNIRYAEAAASVLTLQRSMLVSFGEMGPEQSTLLNALTGAGACLLICVVGMMLAIKAGKEKTKWQNQNW